MHARQSLERGSIDAVKPAWDDAPHAARGRGAGAAAGAAFGLQPVRRRGRQHRRHAGQHPADPDRHSGFRRRQLERQRNRRATSPRSSPPISSAPACSRRSIRRPTSSRSSNIDALPRFADWRTINAQALVTGRITRQADGRLKSEFRLWDVASAEQLTGAQYFTAPDIWRRVAHIISDAIYQRLTGDTGYFDSRVVFVDESGPKEQRVKRLAIMDQDGANVRILTRGSDLVLTPRFSPSTQEITYMSFVNSAAARLSAQHRDQPARGRRRFPEHELRAALLARRPARDHEPAGGQQLEPVRARSALQAEDPADRPAPRSTPRRPIRRTARASASKAIAAARSRSMS